MSKISNSDKQARFRRKELLKREADKIYHQWELSPNRWRESRREPSDVRQQLEKAVALPSGWTEEDFAHAASKLGQYHLDLISSKDEISNDVDGDWESHAREFMTTPDPVKFFNDNKAAIENAWVLAEHLISALKLSNCNSADQAAALMEAVRFVGRSLVANREIRCSSAVAICLASISPSFDRPEWFAKKLAETIGWKIDRDLSHQVGQYLSQS